MAPSLPAAKLSSPAQATRVSASSWLYAVAALVVLMVVVGGITRLTESGLSMVRWEPVTGIVPPLSEAAWQAEFDAYKAYPEYRTVNRGMSLDEFKRIYFWEWAHRLLGRVIGLAFALPLLWFWLRGRIPAGFKPRLLALLALGGLQGVIGWWMVASGLVDRPDVSHVRLAVHLNLALFILAALVWTGMDMRRGAKARLTGLGAAALAALFVQTILGAFVAGLDAGYAYAEWPTMGGTLAPATGEWLEPVWRNYIDNPIFVQWLHRWWAFVAAGLIVWLAVRSMRHRAYKSAAVLEILLIVQIALGISTLLSGVELWIAAAHQAIAALIVIWTAAAANRVGRPEETRT